MLIEYKTLRNVVSSAAKAETCGIFHNTQTVVPIRQIRIVLHHPQPPTIIKNDNSTTLGFTYNNFQLKRSKCWGINLNCLRDTDHQKQYEFFWEKDNSEDTLNEVDYYTENHPTIYQRCKRGRYANNELSTFN